MVIRKQAQYTDAEDKSHQCIFVLCVVLFVKVYIGRSPIYYANILISVEENIRSFILSFFRSV